MDLKPHKPLKLLPVRVPEETFRALQELVLRKNLAKEPDDAQWAMADVVRWVIAIGVERAEESSK